MQALRTLWIRCHRWTALCLGWVLVMSGVTGSLLVVARPLDRWLHPAYFVAVTPAGEADARSPVSLEALRQRLAGEFGARASFTFAPPREPGDTLQVLVRAAWRGTLYLDPATGAEQGRRGANEGVVALLYGLHSALWMDQTGKAVLACAALSYLVLLMTGAILWWPRKWPPSLGVAFGKGWTRALFDVHRTGGVVLGLALALCIATGAYLAWRPIGGWITWLSGEPRTAAPALPAASGAAQASAAAASLDELAARAQAALPEGAIGYFLYSPRLDRPLAVRMRVPDDPHPNGRSTVWLDPRSGAVLAIHRWNELDPGTRVNSYIYPLHTGELGGVAWQAAVAMLGLTLAALGGSGIWLWWRRRMARRRTGRMARMGNMGRMAE
ncbi:PepSY-associated TM helix domain-containing protein [Bordetella flabilis]|uniref:Peptidase n=1 Tax=Bordetella flabilis TaxID=463014 RepID=A0A193GF46_9BORD|nr:PepSY-associated TM helix domain-containing protein [Bordetella flabilis]ANN77914.1 hypothetical protein BAU07_13150 [Bordetella flabilis]